MTDIPLCLNIVFVQVIIYPVRHLVFPQALRGEQLNILVFVKFLIQ